MLEWSLESGPEEACGSDNGFLVAIRTELLMETSLLPNNVDGGQQELEKSSYVRLSTPTVDFHPDSRVPGLLHSYALVSSSLTRDPTYPPP